jgi:hypothetical protein
MTVTETDSSFVRFATVMRGAQPFKEGNVNDTFRGQVLVDGGIIRSAIIKDLDPKELANELMVAALAKAIDMPIPDAYLAAAAQDVLNARKGPELPDGSRLVFASADAQTPPVAQLYLGAPPVVALRVLQRLAEWSGIGRLYGFDAWVANVDRHHRNLLFSGDKKVWLIDHGYCFSGPKWKAADLVPEKAYRHRLGEWLTPVMIDSRRAAVAGVAAITCDQVADLDLRLIGDLNHVSGILDSNDFAALVEFLRGRSSHVPRLAAVALNISLVV